MKMDGLLVRAASSELQSRLEGARVQRVYQPDSVTLCLEVFSGRDRPVLLISTDPQLASLHLEDSLKGLAAPPPFVMLLRKHVMGARITGISQLGWDRVVKISLTGYDAAGDERNWNLWLEILGAQTNLYLVDEQGRVTGRLRPRHGRLEPGEIYQPPASDKLSLSESREAFLEDFRKKWSWVRPEDTLSRAVFGLVDGLGPITAREVVWRAGYLPQVPVANLGDPLKTAEHLAQACLSLLESVRELKIEPSSARVEGKVLVAPFPLEHLGPTDWTRYPTIVEMLASLYMEIRVSRHLLSERRWLEAAVKKNLKRARRKIKKQRLDLKKAGDPESYRVQGELLTAFMHQVSRGDSSVTVPDYHEGGEIRIQLDPALSPSDNAQQYFRRYRKAKRTRDMARRQLRRTEREIEYLEGLELALEAAEDLVDLEDIAREMRRQGLLKKPRARKARRESAPGKPQFLLFRSPSGYPIAVGKNNRQNDFITFRWARPDDLWLHAKDIPGSHVVLSLSGEEPSWEDVEKAAILAAHYSKGRQGGNVEVDVTKVTNVQKPRGAAPGYVTYTGHRTLFVTPESDLLPEPWKGDRG